MGYLAHLKRNNHCSSCRWVVKYNSDDIIREVKLVYEPSEYNKSNANKYGNKARKLHTREQVIAALEWDKEKRNV
tara:strand:+ start:6937 stop:7161 length:225 start_codon:yes stop_codon:yes gene_type:complete